VLTSKDADKVEAGRAPVELMQRRQGLDKTLWQPAPFRSFRVVLFASARPGIGCLSSTFSITKNGPPIVDALLMTIPAPVPRPSDPDQAGGAMFRESICLPN
jgi:hypothetical protein